VNRERQDTIVRQEEMVKEPRKAELVRDRLESLKQIIKEYPQGHKYQSLIENLKLDQALEVVEEDTRRLHDALIHPRGT
jgi:NADH:ubiquinone oxidoreductase subunit E